MMRHSTVCCVHHLHMVLPSAWLLAGCTASSACQQATGKRWQPVLTAWSTGAGVAAAWLGLPPSSPKRCWGQ